MGKKDFVVEKDEFIMGIYGGMFSTRYYGRRNNLLEHNFIITNKRIYCEYGMFLTNDLSISIYYKDIVEIKKTVKGGAITVTEVKRASNGKDYTNKYNLVIGGVWSKFNDKVYDDIVGIIGTDKEFVPKGFEVSWWQLVGIVVFFAFVCLVIVISV